MPSPNFKFPVFEVEEEEDEEIPEEISRLLRQEERSIQPYKEPLETVNLGSEEETKEVKVGALLSSAVKGSLIELLKDFSDVFAWSCKTCQGWIPAS